MNYDDCEVWRWNKGKLIRSKDSISGQAENVVSKTKLKDKLYTMYY